LDTSIILFPPLIPENYKKTNNPLKLRFPKFNYERNEIIVLRLPKDEKLARTFLNRFYYYFIIIKQAGPTIIGVDNINNWKQIVIKRVRKPEGSIY